VPLKEIGEGDDEETISSRRRVVALIWVWPMRSLLDIEIMRQREGRGEGRNLRVQNELLVESSKLGPKLRPSGTAEILN
jgi:hypothetical protein